MDYEIPPQVKATKDCRNILSRILVAQPGKRITIPEIQRHPWYLKDLPPGVVDMNDHLPPVSANAQVREPIAAQMRLSIKGRTSFVYCH